MISDAIAMRIPHRAGFPDHGNEDSTQLGSQTTVRWDTPNRKRKNDMTEKCKMVDDQLEQVSGGAGEEKKY